MRTKESNDLFYTCSLIEYISRQTKNKRSDVVDFLGEEMIRHILEYADVFHSEQIAEVAERFIEECQIPNGDFDNIDECKYRVPTYWELGAVYQRLIENVSNGDIVDTLLEVYHSWISPLIDNYNIAVYYMTPEYLKLSYEEGELLE